MRYYEGYKDFYSQKDMITLDKNYNFKKNTETLNWLMGPTYLSWNTEWLKRYVSKAESR